MWFHLPHFNAPSVHFMKYPISAFCFPAVFLAASIALGQTQTPGSPSPGPKGRPSATASPGSSASPSASVSQQSYTEAVQMLKARIGAASETVMVRITNQEKDVRNRFAYFQKPERLDPNSFATKEEIDPWRTLLDEFKQSKDLAAKLYLNADADLDNALTNQRLTRKIVDPIRKELISTFPWESINKRNQLLQNYIDEHRSLLDFFATNWGTWSKGPEEGKPVFSDPKLAATYQGIRDKVAALGKQITDLNAKILQ
ncbi:MAG TPA: hypothetical protein VFO40_03845 [Chthoniobacterales bacterium]|nr:hypothetical protein [Chthoniobacterales bacterium]